jgi:hypothetical protein
MSAAAAGDGALASSYGSKGFFFAVVSRRKELVDKGLYSPAPLFRKAV